MINLIIFIVINDKVVVSIAWSCVEQYYGQQNCCPNHLVKSDTPVQSTGEEMKILFEQWTLVGRLNIALPLFGSYNCYPPPSPFRRSLHCSAIFVKRLTMQPSSISSGKTFTETLVQMFIIICKTISIFHLNICKLRNIFPPKNYGLNGELPN